MTLVRPVPAPSPAQITLDRRANAKIALPLQVAREVARTEGVDWDALPAHERMERVAATSAVIVAYQSIVTTPLTGGHNRFPAGTEHAAFVDGMIWNLGQVPFPSEVRRVHAEALHRFGPIEGALEAAHG